MKLLSGFNLTLLLFVISAGQVLTGQSTTQSGRIIPVYPGSELKTALDPEDSKICCSFISKAGFDRVVAYYESSLNLKSVDINGLATQLPFMKEQTDMLQKQMSPEMKIRFFVLKVIEYQGKKGAELFEVYTGKAGVQYSIMESQLTADDKHFSAEWYNKVEANPDQKSTYGPVSAGTKVLVSALPSSGPEGFIKGELETYADPDQVNIMYSKLKKKGSGGPDGDLDEFYQVRITISDEKAALESAVEMLKAGANNEKVVKVKGKYDGKEIINQNEYGCEQSNVTFLVNNRFLVEINADLICDLNVIYKLIDKMNFESLPK